MTDTPTPKPAVEETAGASDPFIAARFERVN